MVRDRSEVKGMWTRMLRVAMALCMSALIVGAMGCGEDGVPDTKVVCTSDDDCEMGTVCAQDSDVVTSSGTGRSCNGTIGCEFCQVGQVCLVRDDGSSACSVPECFGNSDCVSPETCMSGLCAQAGCDTKADCPAGKVCNLNGGCVDPPSTCSNNEQCPAGEVCLEDGTCRAGCASDTECLDTEYCVDSTKICATGCRMGSCQAGQTCDLMSRSCMSMVSNCTMPGVTCPNGQVCNMANGMCEAPVDRCAGVMCAAGEICNPNTGMCMSSTCNATPADMMCTAPTQYWSQDLCACVECRNSLDCSNGLTCNTNGQCVTCTVTCNPSTPGTCGGNAPYCTGGCCNECIGAADCPQGELCLGGECAVPPSCANDPNACTNGLVCNTANGMCEAPMIAPGTSCDPADPMSCPFGQFCTPGANGMGTCEGGLGGGTCGLCNADCTCPGNATCDGFFCSGCTPDMPLLPFLDFGVSADCPNNGNCLVLPGEPGRCIF